MKLATYQDGSRDGQLVVVSEDLEMAHFASESAHTVKQLLEDWNFIYPQLQDLSQTLNQGKARHAFAFDPAMCMAPLPRTHLRLVLDAYASESEGAAQVALASGDGYFGAQKAIPTSSKAWHTDFELQLSVITSDVAQGVNAQEALQCVRLVLINHDLKSIALESRDVENRFVHRPAACFSAVAITPDELGLAWREGRLHGVMHASVNGRKIALLETAQEMRWGFGDLIACAAQTRSLSAGTIISAGPIVNAQTASAQGSSVQWANGFASLEAKRAHEQEVDGQTHTDFLNAGDHFKAEFKTNDARAPFGALLHEVVS